MIPGFFSVDNSDIPSGCSINNLKERKDNFRQMPAPKIERGQSPPGTVETPGHEGAPELHAGVTDMPPAGRLVPPYPNNNPLVRSQSQAGKTHKKPKTAKIASVPWTEADDKRLAAMVQRTVRPGCGVCEQHATAARAQARMRRPPPNLKT
jgi:hypothetical protein